ncbi:thioredoxin-like protein YLS8 [Lolium perenne]|uniref:thioredoxin-like protein YLS8 n=1 Tax=Lolium perenne TaxID=4522 RepID=UPI0021F614EC|nr:thioredoxin-like protein YLS8 [Lolium perenne]
MAHHVEHLHAAEAVDDAIVREAETERLVVVRFGHSVHADCLSVDAAMAAAAELVGPIAVLHAVDIEEVQDFNAMYELHDRPCTVMFFHGNRHVDVRGPHGSRYDIAWAAYNADEFVGLVWTVHERATAGRRLVDLD